MSDLLAWTLIAACGLLGFFGVSFFLNETVAKADKARTDQNKERQDELGDAPIENSTASWFEILEVKQDCSFEELQAAYRKKIMQYHPDRVYSLGPELKTLAEAKMKEINSAFDDGKRIKKLIKRQRRSTSCIFCQTRTSTDHCGRSAGLSQSCGPWGARRR